MNNTDTLFQQVLDLRIADVPAGYFTPMMVAQYGQKELGLVILAERTS